MRCTRALRGCWLACALATAACDEPSAPQEEPEAGRSDADVGGEDAASPFDAGRDASAGPFGSDGEAGSDAGAPLGDADVLDAQQEGGALPDAATDAGSCDAADSCVPGSSPELLDVDLLFVIDNSGSMATEQQKLGSQLPRLVGALASGDRYYGATPPPGTPDASRFFPQLRSLHLGVVSTNVGGLDAYDGNLAALNSCVNGGDDGRLQNATTVAEEGVVAGGTQMNPEFRGYLPGEAVLEPDPSCALDPQPPYQDYVPGGAVSADDVARRFRCLAQLGVRGCPHEQPLEAMWKALAPSSGTGELYTFVTGSGQGDAANRGFLREQAVLAVVPVSDEEDCSMKPAARGLFDASFEAEQAYGPLNLRCWLHADDSALIQPTTRYVDGLRSLKPAHPERIVFAPIVGIPVGATGMPYDAILALPELQFAELEPSGEVPNRTGLPRPSCSVPNAARPEEAYPPRRVLEVARDLGEGTSLVHSICADDYGPAIDALIDRIANKLRRSP